MTVRKTYEQFEKTETPITVLLSKIYGGFVSARGSVEALRRLCGGSAEALRRLCGGSADALFPMRSVFLEMRSPWTIAPVNYLHTRL